VPRTLALITASLALLAFAPGAHAAGGHVPRASDFELSPRGPVSHSASGAVSSRPLRAPRRFSLVGLRWRGRAVPSVWLRVRRAGHRWTRWVRLPGEPDGAPDPGSREAGGGHGESSPVWVGSADYVQYRLSKPVPGLRIHFVRVQSDGWRPRAVRAQSPGEPPIQPRSAWDPGNQCPPRTAPLYGDVQVAFVHHTVSLNDYQPQDVPSIILGICRFHRNSNGWNDIGYNFLVDKFGTLWEGRAGGIDQPVVGAQAQGFNSHSTGIANIGTFDDVPETDAAMNAMAQLIRWKLPLSGAPTYGSVTVVSAGGSSNRYPSGTPVTLDRISGHRDVDATDCPGGDLYAQLPTLRQLVGSVGPAVQQRTRLSAALTPSLIVYPNATQVTGTLALIDSTPFGGAPLQLQVFGRGGWHTVAQGTAAPDGSFSLPFAPRAGHVLRVTFTGDPGHLPSSSARLRLSVRPLITLRRSVKRAAVGRAAVISGTISPAKSRLRLVITRKSGTRTTRVASFSLRARGGRFRQSYRLPAPGLYSYRVTFGGDRANAPAGSATIRVRALASRARGKGGRTRSNGGAGR
jgi:N-acetylmuramoyl-L-alanine amidase-like protein